MSNVRQTVVKLPRVADDTCCGVHDPLQLVRQGLYNESNAPVTSVTHLRDLYKYSERELKPASHCLACRHTYLLTYLSLIICL